MTTIFKKTAVILLASVFITSCKKELLTPVPQTSVTDVTAFDTPDRVLNQVRSLYSALKNGNFYGGRYIVYGDIRGEDFINETSNVVTGFDVYLLNCPGTSQNSVKNLWSQAYYTITPPPPPFATCLLKEWQQKAHQWWALLLPTITLQKQS